MRNPSEPQQSSFFGNISHFLTTSLSYLYSSSEDSNSSESTQQESTGESGEGLLSNTMYFFTTCASYLSAQTEDERLGNRQHENQSLRKIGTYVRLFMECGSTLGLFSPIGFTYKVLILLIDSLNSHTVDSLNSHTASDGSMPTISINIGEPFSHRRVNAQHSLNRLSNESDDSDENEITVSAAETDDDEFSGSFVL